MNSNANGFCIDARCWLRVKSAEQLNGLTFDMCDAVEQIRNIVISTIRANRAGGDAGKTGLANLCVERRRLAHGNCIDWANAKTRRAF
jgi:hypothetical protein